MEGLRERLLVLGEHDRRGREKPPYRTGLRSGCRGGRFYPHNKGRSRAKWCRSECGSRALPTFSQPGGGKEKCTCARLLIQLACDVDAGRFEHRDFVEQRRQVNHHAVADNGLLAGAENAARNQLEDELLLANEDGMAGVVAALIAGDDIEPFREKVDDFALCLRRPTGNPG